MPLVYFSSSSFFFLALSCFLYVFFKILSPVPSGESVNDWEAQRWTTVFQYHVLDMKNPECWLLKGSILLCPPVTEQLCDTDYIAEVTLVGWNISTKTQDRQ